jgi:hypothetical protein
VYTYAPANPAAAAKRQFGESSSPAEEPTSARNASASADAMAARLESLANFIRHCFRSAESPPTHY